MKENRKNCRKYKEKNEKTSLPRIKAVKSKTAFQSTWDYIPSDLSFYQAHTMLGTLLA